MIPPMQKMMQLTSIEKRRPRKESAAGAESIEPVNVPALSMAVTMEDSLLVKSGSPSSLSI